MAAFDPFLPLAERQPTSDSARRSTKGRPPSVSGAALPKEAAGVYASCAKVGRRRLMTTPIPAKPSSIIAQVAGSGTEPTAAPL